MPASPLDAAHETTRRITTLSVATAVLLIVMKAFALGASGSVSILASLADSTLDLIASLATFFAVRWAAAPPDEDHRYGHGKGEALAALVQAGLVFASALFIGWEGLQRIFDPRPVTAGSWAVGVVIASIAVTGWLVWMQTRALKTSGSLAVAGDRAHYAADLAS
ncbi:MAG: cation diffusion facilitator family transporter, partial [Proteobacteria bacterium]|nr:cation diffusion facilitator family transporter [Pseudomonadota bacterium]